MDRHKDSSNSIILIPGESSATDSPSWLTATTEHVLTRSPSSLALIIPDEASVIDIARKIADTAQTLTQERHVRTAAALLIRKNAKRADAIQAIHAIPGRIALIFEPHDVYLQSDSMTKPLWHVATEEGLPLIIVIPHSEWEELCSEERDESLPAGTTVIHMAHSVCHHEIRTHLLREAKELETFHGVTIPSETIDAAADASHTDETRPSLSSAHTCSIYGQLGPPCTARTSSNRPNPPDQAAPTSAASSNTCAKRSGDRTRPSTRSLNRCAWGATAFACEQTGYRARSC